MPMSRDRTFLIVFYIRKRQDRVTSWSFLGPGKLHYKVCRLAAPSPLAIPQYVSGAVSGFLFPKHVFLASVPRTVPRSAVNTARRLFEPLPLSPPAERAQTWSCAARPTLELQASPTHARHAGSQCVRFSIWRLFFFCFTRRVLPERGVRGVFERRVLPLIPVRRMRADSFLTPETLRSFYLHFLLRLAPAGLGPASETRSRELRAGSDQFLPLQDVKYEIWTPTCDQLPDLVVGGLPEEAQQGGHAATVPQRHLVVVGGFAVHQVPQRSAGALLDLGRLVVQLVHQVLDASQVTHLHSRERWIENKTFISAASSVAA